MNDYFELVNIFCQQSRVHLFKLIFFLFAIDHEVDAEVPDPVLKEIAVNILACFAHYESLASEPDMVDRIPGLSRLLDAKSELNNEVLNILLCVSQKKEGLVKMLDPDVLKNIFSVLLETTDKDRMLCTQLITTVYARACHLLHEQKIPSLSSALKYSLSTLISILSNTLNHDQKMLKFEALTILASVLPDVPTDVRFFFFWLMPSPQIYLRICRL